MIHSIDPMLLLSSLGLLYVHVHEPFVLSLVFTHFFCDVTRPSKNLLSREKIRASHPSPLQDLKCELFFAAIILRSAPWFLHLFDLHMVFRRWVLVLVESWSTTKKQFAKLFHAHRKHIISIEAFSFGPQVPSFKRKRTRHAVENRINSKRLIQSLLFSYFSSSNIAISISIGSIGAFDFCAIAAVILGETKFQKNTITQQFIEKDVARFVVKSKSGAVQPV